MPRSLWFGLVVMVGLSAGVMRAETNDCDDKPLAAHDLQARAGDAVDATHLGLHRAFDGTGKLEVSVCNADVRVVTRQGAQELDMTVNIDRGSQPAANYVRSFRVDGSGGVVQLKFPKELHAKVTLTLPMREGSSFALNLGRGELDYVAAGGAGSRQIKLGFGSMKLAVDDKTYRSMEVNIGMGRLRDHRPGGRDGSFVVSKDYTGHGDGALEINIGAGSLDVRGG